MLAAFVGQDTFKELKVVFEELELDRYQESVKGYPLDQFWDAGSTQRAGFSIPAVDCDHLKYFILILNFFFKI